MRAYYVGATRTLSPAIFLREHRATWQGGLRRVIPVVQGVRADLRAWSRWADSESFYYTNSNKQLRDAHMHIVPP